MFPASDQCVNSRSLFSQLWWIWQVVGVNQGLRVFNEWGKQHRVMTAVDFDGGMKRLQICMFDSDNKFGFYSQNLDWRNAMWCPKLRLASVVSWCKVWFEGLLCAVQNVVCDIWWVGGCKIWFKGLQMWCPKMNSRILQLDVLEILFQKLLEFFLQPIGPWWKLWRWSNKDKLCANLKKINVWKQITVSWTRRSLSAYPTFNKEKTMMKQ